MQRLARFIAGGGLLSAGLVASLLGCLQLEVTDPGTDITVLPAGGKHVLFIGNSLTYTNNLPRTVADLASASGDTIRVYEVALPNFAVIDHALGMSNAVSVIQSQPWDYVVLQQGPTTTQVNRDTLILASKLLDPYVRAAGGRTALLMAWPHMSQPHLFDAVRASSQMAAQSVGGIMIPAGQAWREAMLVDPTVQLYGGDGYHPGPLGTYLAALVAYERITGKDPRLLPPVAVVGGITMTVAQETVRFLQAVAHETASRY